uniref:Uncharacterized protein n=1 Tax=Amphora coffeiformis TaxID=265554 RepID=A0A7S3L0T2_9STRA
MRRSAGEKEDPLADSSASSRERTRRRWDGTFVADDEAAAAEQGQGGPLELPATTTTTALPAIPDQPSLSYLLQRGHLHMHRNVRRNQPSTTTTSTTTTTTTTRPPHRHMARLPRSDTLRALLLDDHDHDDDDDDEKVSGSHQTTVQMETDKLLSTSSIQSTLEKEEDCSPSPKRNFTDPCSAYFGCDVLLGATVGFGSTLTGTSGPLLFLPAVFLSSSSSPCHEEQEISGTQAVALSQTIGAPMALCMTLGTLWWQHQLQQSNENDTADSSVDIDLGLSLVVGVATSLCVPWGERGMRVLRRRLSSANYGREGDGLVTALVSFVVLGSGVYMLMAPLG